MRVQSLGWEDSLEEGMATHPSILTWRIPRTEESGTLQSIGLQRVGPYWSNWVCTHEPLKKKKKNTYKQGVSRSCALLSCSVGLLAGGKMGMKSIQSYATSCLLSEILQQDRVALGERLSQGLYEAFARQSHKLRPTGTCLARRGGRSIAGENPEPEVSLESSRKQKTGQMAREQRAWGEQRAGSIRGWKHLVPPGMAGRTPWGTFQGQ